MRKKAEDNPKLCYQTLKDYSKSRKGVDVYEYEEVPKQVGD